MGSFEYQRATGSGDPSGFGPKMTSTITLSVPARPEALGIVRLVLMSCGAAAGIDIDEIFARSQEVVESFTNTLVSQPEASSIVIRTQVGATDVDLVPVDWTKVRP